MEEGAEGGAGKKKCAEKFGFELQEISDTT